MSMMYCHNCDRHWDSDFEEVCPECYGEDEQPKGTTRLLTYDTGLIFNGTGQPVHRDMWALVNYVGHQEWRVIYQTNDFGLHNMMRDCIQLCERWPDHPYAIVAPDFKEETQ